MRFKVRFWSVCRKFHKMSEIFRPSKNFVKMFLKMWKEECHVQRLKVNHHTPEDFTRCCLQKREEVLPIWIAYRAVLFLYFLATTIYTIFDLDIPEKDRPKYLIFLTNWTYMLEFYQFFIAFIITVLRFVIEQKNRPVAPMDKMPWYYRLYWIIFTITLPCAIVVSVIFWCSIYDPVLFPANSRNVIVHGFNSLFMILDFCLVAHPVRFLHVYWPCFYGLLYVLFTVIYQLSGGTGVKGLIPIYKILDWRYPDKASVTFVLCFFFLLVLHSLFSLLSMLKFYMKKKMLENE